MKELTLDDIKKVSIDLLQDMHEFCVEHNLKYSLGFGTLIGAIRHKGFIPWDDDIDIMMPRPDYELFCREYKSKRGHKLIAPCKKGCYISYARVVEVDKTLVVSPADWNSKTSGVWIDIFPVDGATDDADTMKSIYQDVRKIYAEQIERRFIATKRNKGIRGRLYYWKENILGRCNVEKYARDYDTLCKKIAFGETKHVCVITCPNSGVLAYFELTDFDEYELIPFDNHEFYAIKAYDKVLRVSYGDYMKLPPIEKQVPCHGSHKYYWR